MPNGPARMAGAPRSSRAVDAGTPRRREERSGPAAEAAPAGRPMRVLLVEDEALTLFDLDRLLTRFGYRLCGTASTAQEAVAEAERLRPDLVLMDIGLRGGSDGILAAIEIRSRLGIPIVYISGRTDPATRCRADLAEPLGFIAKPFTPERVDLTLRDAATLLDAD